MDYKEEDSLRKEEQERRAGDMENGECCRKDASCPPEIPEEMKVEQEWADKLGMEYDAEEVASRPKPPVYVLPPEEPLPPVTPSAENPQPPMPPTFMLWAVLATICCCLPAGIVALIFSTQVSSRYFARNYEGARRASRLTEIWIIVSIVTSIIVNALYLPLSVLSGLG